MAYLFLSFNSDSINTVCLSLNIKVFRKISQSGRRSAFFLVIFGKLLRACFIVPGPAKLKIIRVRSVRNDVPFASCPSNRRHSEYYSCQTVLEFITQSISNPCRQRYQDKNPPDKNPLDINPQTKPPGQKPPRENL